MDGKKQERKIGAAGREIWENREIFSPSGQNTLRGLQDILEREDENSVRIAHPIFFGGKVAGRGLAPPIAQKEEESYGKTRASF